MFGRRSHSRFSISLASDAVLRVLRDVIVQRSVNDEITVLSHEPGIVGDLMVMELPELETTIRVQTRVIDSRPVVIDGAIRHSVRLRKITSTSNQPAGPFELAGPSVETS